MSKAKNGWTIPRLQIVLSIVELRLQQRGQLTLVNKRVVSEKVKHFKNYINEAFDSHFFLNFQFKI